MRVKKSFLLGAVWIMIFMQVLLISCSNDATAAWQKELEKCSREKKFACLLLDNGNVSENKAAREVLKKVADKHSDKIGAIEVNFKEGQKTLEKEFNLRFKEVPLALVVAPNGAVTGMFDKNIKSEMIERAMVSSDEADMILALQKGQAVFLCFYKQKSDELERVKSELGEIEKFFKGAASAQYLNTSELAESSLIKKLPPFESDSVVVFTVLPPGNVRSKLEGDQIKRVNLLKAFQSCCPTGSSKDGKECK